jgi:hypothetical protein
MADATCSIPGCDGPVIARGWCGRCYARWRRNGDPTLRQAADAAERRFWAKVDKHGPIPEYRPDLGPCWLWTAFINPKGYGQFYLGRPMHAHRAAWMLFVGPIPDGMVPDHLCRVRHCVKAIPDEYGPAHLEVVTGLENALRGTVGWVGRWKTHCPQGHPYDEANTYRSPRNRRICRTCQQKASREYERRKRAQRG